MKLEKNIRIIIAAVFICVMLNGKAYSGSEIGDQSYEKKETVDRLLKNGDTCFQNQQFLSPKESNAYDFYKKVLEIQPSNPHALKKIYSISESLLNILAQNVKIYEKLMREESEGKDVRTGVIEIITKILSNLEDSKTICEEYPKKDAETEKMHTLLSQNIVKYKKLRLFYQQKLNN